MSREPMLMPKAQRQVSDFFSACIAMIALVIVGATVGLLLIGAVLIRLAPLIVAVFAAIILARCSGVL